MKWQAAVRLIGFLVFLAVLGGCSSIVGEGTPATRFFIISSLAPPPAPGAAANPQHEISVALEPLLIPSYLDRPQIVTRTGKNELNMAEFNQWGENLRGNLARVLIENLSLLLDSDRIYRMPGLKRQTPDFRVLVRIIQFEKGGDGTVSLAVRWKLYNRDGKKILFRENIVLTGKKIAERDYSAVAQAMSLLLTEFSQRMADTIHRQPLPVR